MKLPEIKDIDSIVNSAIEYYNEKLKRPNNKEIHKINRLFFDFINEKGYKYCVYGGTAIDFWNGDITPDQQIDVDIYVNENYLMVSKEIADYFHEKGYSGIRVVTGFKPTTRKIFIEHSDEALFDINYIPDWVWKNIKTYEKNGIKFIEPNYLKIDQYRIISYSVFEFGFKIEKAYNRLLKLEENYPIDNDSDNNGDNGIMSLVDIEKKLVKHDDKVIEKLINSGLITMSDASMFAYYTELSNLDNSDNSDNSNFQLRIDNLPPYYFTYDIDKLVSALDKEGLRYELVTKGHRKYSVTVILGYCKIEYIDARGGLFVDRIHGNKLLCKALLLHHLYFEYYASGKNVLYRSMISHLVDTGLDHDISYIEVYYNKTKPSITAMRIPGVKTYKPDTKKQINNYNEVFNTVKKKLNH